ncbi:MAG TPA: TetR/AcrR family transcriptional regulator [Vicinamibacterales bacterium]
MAPSEQDEHTRTRLLRAAVRVFDRKGYAAASVREIVELANVTKPALYYHFGNKEGLITAILEDAAREFMAAMERATARQGTTRDRLTGLYDELNALFVEHIPVVRVAHSLFHGPAEGVPNFNFSVFDRGLLDALCRIYEDGLRAGEVRSVDPADAALALMGIVGACAAHQMHPEFPPLDGSRLHRVLDIVCDGLLVERREQGER